MAKKKRNPFRPTLRVPRLPTKAVPDKKKKAPKYRFDWKHLEKLMKDSGW